MKMIRDNNEYPAVTCVVSNWNGWRDTDACLRALDRTLYGKLSVIVVDNGFIDDSVRRIRDLHVNIELVIGKNAGFAGGNDAGITFRKVKLTGLLNNDTEPAPEALTELVKTRSVESIYEFGAIRYLLLYTHSRNTVQAWVEER